MAPANREEAPKRRRKKKKPQDSPPVKPPPKKKKKSYLGVITAIVGLIALSWAALPKEDTRGDINKIVPSVVGVLDQIFLGCTVYWYQMGSQNPCNQKIVDTLFNSKTSDIKVTVTTKKDEKFSATATHVNNPVILKVDSDGDVFIKVKDCDFNIDTIDTSDVNLEELAGQCHSGAAPPKTSS